MKWLKGSFDIIGSNFTKTIYKYNIGEDLALM